MGKDGSDLIATVQHREESMYYTYHWSNLNRMLKVVTVSLACEKD